MTRRHDYEPGALQAQFELQIKFADHDPKNKVVRIGEVIRAINPVLRGWGGYFRTGNASGKFNAVDS